MPNNATRSLAFSLGPLPHAEPVQQSVPFLAAQAPPIQGNVTPDTTAGYMQYVPAASPTGLPPSPGCIGETEGHFCPQLAPEAIDQRRDFFQTAITDVAPVIIDPLP